MFFRKSEIIKALRQANDDIETPFATAEIKIGNSLTVNQCYGDKDRTVPEVEDFVSAWLKYSNKQYKKLQGA